MSAKKQPKEIKKEEKLFTLKEAQNIWLEGGKASRNMFQGRDYVEFTDLEIVQNKTK